ncbi:head-tail connector protein [Variovorax boronicumulans]|uniref:head-tail connector protein n=1 Tax=Variovorax boronicumulans TaxID=436515 RepID=UPI001C55D88F
MPVVTLDQARAHLRLEADYPADQVEPYIAGAVDAAAQYLNRAIFDDWSSLDAALAALPAARGTARSAYKTAADAAALLEDPADRADALSVAQARLDFVTAETGRVLNGIVVNPSIVTAVLLTLGHLFSNREDVVVGVTATDVPNGARSLLRGDRRVMMP